MIYRNIYLKDGKKWVFHSFVNEKELASRQIYIQKYAKIGENVRIGDCVKIGLFADIKDEVVIDFGAIIQSMVYIGEKSKIGSHTEIYDKTKIHNDVVLGNDVIVATTCDIGYGTRIGDDSYIREDCTIGNSVKIGKNVKTGVGVIIKTGAVIGNGSEILYCVIGEKANIKPNTKLEFNIYIVLHFIEFLMSEELEITYTGNNSLCMNGQNKSIDVWLRDYQTIFRKENSPENVDRLKDVLDYSKTIIEKVEGVKK